MSRETAERALSDAIDQLVATGPRLKKRAPDDLARTLAAAWNRLADPDMLAEESGIFLERRLIHRTARGELVRSISEVVVADSLNVEGIDYHYEKTLRGADGIDRYPDFTAEDTETGVTVYWEHLGMLSDPG